MAATGTSCRLGDRLAVCGCRLRDRQRAARQATGSQAGNRKPEAAHRVP
jgi:hypothetical protein